MLRFEFKQKCKAGNEIFGMLDGVTVIKRCIVDSLDDLYSIYGDDIEITDVEKIKCAEMRSWNSDLIFEG